MPDFRWSVFEADLDPVTGSEQKGIRPVLVISNEEFNRAMPNITVLPLTSTKRRLYPSEVFLPAGTAGQPADSIVMAHQVRTISKTRLGTRIGRLDNIACRIRICAAVKEHFDID
jgi:mRNA interferase MazF